MSTCLSDDWAKPQPQGKTRKELLAIVNADLRRWDELAEIWDDLMPHEQQELIETARAMAKREVPA